MEKINENEVSLYKRFMNSKAFYPVVLSLIAALSVSIWAINRSNKMLSTTAQYSQTQSYTAGDFFGEPTTAVQNTTANPDLNTTEATEKTTLAYESNKAYKGEWLLPVNGEIGKDYSSGKLVKSATMGDYRVHDGIDIKAKSGAKILCANSGKVLEIYNDAFWGTVIVVDHGGGVIAKYCGLGKDTAVEKEQILEKGTVLGTLATIPCEQKDESHLHFETTVNSESKDPIAVMNMLNSDLAD